MSLIKGADLDAQDVFLVDIRGNRCARCCLLREWELLRMILLARSEQGDVKRSSLKCISR